MIYRVFPIMGMLSLALCACAPYNPTTDHKAGVCNELNSQMIFNGQTSNIRQSEIENAEKPLAQRNYDKKCE